MFDGANTGISNEEEINNILDSIASEMDKKDKEKVKSIFMSGESKS